MAVITISGIGSRAPPSRRRLPGAAPLADKNTLKDPQRAACSSSPDAQSIPDSGVDSTPTRWSGRSSSRCCPGHHGPGPARQYGDHRPRGLRGAGRSATCSMCASRPARENLQRDGAPGHREPSRAELRSRRTTASKAFVESVYGVRWDGQGLRPGDDTGKIARTWPRLGWSKA
jgi:hypothetical protein